MNHVLLIPDSFKGTMSSSEICDIIEEGLLAHFPALEVRSIPVADGGEGSVDAFLQALGGQKKYTTVQGPFGEKMESFYGILPNNVGVVEMAACAGLPLVGETLRPDITTTYGVGELILAAAEAGCTHIIVGLGGSATNDGGCGAAAACGVTFTNHSGERFIPTGGTLHTVASIDVSTRNPILDSVTITTMCDIDNPFYGVTGAAHIFGPQKGADPAMVQRLDSNLKALSDVISKDIGLDVQAVPGSGAAGGMGGGMAAFFGSELQMGIETVLDAVNFDELIKASDLIITGEGKIDGQSLRGKVVIGVGRRAKKSAVPVIALVGDIADDADGAYEEGVSAIFSINRLAIPFSEAKKRAPLDLLKTVDNLARFLKLMNF